MILLVIKLLIKSQTFQKIYNKIIHRQLQMNMIKKYLKREIYLQKKDKKLLINWDENSIIIEYQKIINLIDNKTADVVANLYNGRITKVSKNSQQNDPETVTNENDKGIPEERYISPEGRQDIVGSFGINIIV